MGVFGGGVFGAGLFGGGTSLDLIVQDLYPDRVLLTATGLVAGQIYSITRRPAGSTVRTPVRGANNVTAANDAAVVVDAEQPFGVQLTYTLTVDGLDIDSEVVTVTLAGGKVALSDAIAGNASEVVILAWPEKSHDVQSSVFKIAGRNIVVSGQAGGFEGGLELFTETNDARANVVALLKSATSGILQVRQSGGYDDVDAYVHVRQFIPTRWSQDGSDQRRVIVLDVVETAPWAPGLNSSTFTYQDVADAYTGQSYADLAADYASYLAVAQGDFSS